MTKRLNNTSSYLIDDYAVVLTRIHNDVNGNPRYQAELIPLGNLNACKYSCVARYTFTGHYMADVDEARRIVEHHKKQQ